MIDSKTLRGLDKGHLLEDFSRLVDEDRHNTASLIVYIAEIDRRKLYLEHACSSMFAFCTERFRMSEAMTMRQIRTGRAASRFHSAIPPIRSVADSPLHAAAASMVGGVDALMSNTGV